MITPEYLKPGDKVGLVAPARSVSPDQMEAFLELMKSWELEVIPGQHLYDVHHIFAGREFFRTDDLQTMLDHRQVKAVFCARGGYGTLQIIDNVCWEGLMKYPKWVVGFSDITVLHGQLHNRCQMKSIHAPMPFNFYLNKLTSESIESLKGALFGPPVSYTWENRPFTRSGKARGMLVGGNLSLLFAMQGSSSEFPLEDKILFIEDVDEYLYHLERMLISLKRSGRLSRLAGLVVGGMTELKDNPVPFGKSIEEIIYGVTDHVSYPVALGLPAGHGDENRALVLGATVELEVGEKQTLQYL